MGVMPYHVRLAELWMLQKNRTLSDAEGIEMTHCLTANAKYCWDIVTLQSKSQVAYEAGDMEWLHSICAELEAMEIPHNTKKKPDRKGTDKK